MNSLLQSYFQQLEKNKVRTWQMLGGIDEEKFHWKKDVRTWSLAQVMDHVIYSEASALAYCKKKMLAGDNMPNASILNTLKIQIYFWALQTKLRFKAPKPISNPKNDQSLAEIKAYWDQTRAEYASFLESYPDSYLNKAVFRHPLAGRIKLSEMLRFLNTHVINHQFQIARILKSM